MSEWRYLAIRLNGDGTQTPLHPELPLTSPRIMDDLSGPGGFTATIEPEVRALQTPQGDPVFLPWSTLILAEKDGDIKGGGILETLTENGPRLSLDCVGPAGYPKGLPFMLDESWVGVDPMDITRHMWNHLQGQTGGNLGAIIKANTSPVRLGTPERDTNFTTGGGQDVSFSSGPYSLGWYKTHDVGREIDDLARTTPFQYRTTWDWVGDKAVPTIEYRYPSLGRRVTEGRFVVGENVVALPALEYGGDGYANEVMVFGAGSGRDIRNGSYGLPRPPRLRRVAILEDKSITTNARAKAMAVAELRQRQGQAEITDLLVEDGPNARIGSFVAGDEILVSTSNGWSGSLDMWCKIISIEILPATGKAYVQVIRTEKVG